MNIKQYLLISTITFFIGIIIFAYFNNLILINYQNFEKNNENYINSLKAKKKEVTLYFWKNNSWKTEKVIIIKKNDLATTLQHLISKWLIVLEEEKILNKNITLQSVLLCPNNHTAYCSFEKTILNKELCVQKKLYIIESLLKTIKENSKKIQNIYFLVNHQPLQDYHLYFKNSWPIHGYLQ